MLERQLDWLQSNFEIVSGSDFLKHYGGAFKAGKKSPCLLTFDDGTRDHLETVLPILERRCLKAIFFVLTWPLEHQRMPITHALHWILGCPKDIVWDRLVEFANIRLSGICDLGSADIAKQTYFYEPVLTALIKYAVNFALPTDAAEEFVTDFVTSEGYTLKQLTSEWFLKDEEILLLDGADMEIGMHGVSHRSFSSIGEDRIIEEIHHSSTYLRNLVGYPPSWFSSPFGGGDLADAGGLVKKALKEINVFASVTQNKGFVTGASDVYSLPRFDCMYLPPLGNELSDILKKGQGFFDENQ